MSKYRWKITKDYITDAGFEDISDVGTEGPRDADDALKSNPTPFQMYDGDDELYYEGTLYGIYTGWEPLDDFGTPHAGCTSIKIDGVWL